MNNLILETIAVSFELEISNKFEIMENEIIVFLANGKKVKITTMCIA